MAIDRYTVIAAAPSTVAPRNSEPKTATFFSLESNSSVEFSIEPRESATTQGWARYLEGVVSGFARRTEIASFNAVIASNVPVGAGLSSSAALEVATATMLESLTGTKLPPREKALLYQQAEHDFAGVPCGIMDQFTSVFAQPNQLMSLDCNNLEMEFIPFDSPAVSILVFNSNVKHDLAEGEYALRQSDCKSALKQMHLATSWRDVTAQQLDACQDRLTPTQQKRARHVVTEIQRTQQAAIAI